MQYSIEIRPLVNIDLLKYNGNHLPRVLNVVCSKIKRIKSSKKNGRDSKVNKLAATCVIKMHMSEPRHKEGNCGYLITSWLENHTVH